MTTPATFLVIITDVFASPVPLDEVMATSSLDARGLDLFFVLSPLADTVASVASVVASRADGLPTDTTDLTITPAGSAAPWVSANAAGVAAMAVNWWQGVGTLAQISTDGNDVTYLIAVTLTTVAGRSLVFTASQVVSATAS